MLCNLMWSYKTNFTVSISNHITCQNFVQNRLKKTRMHSSRMRATDSLPYGGGGPLSSGGSVGGGALSMGGLCQGDRPCEQND